MREPESAVAVGGGSDEVAEVECEGGEQDREDADDVYF